jgi:hypothetical protein
MSALLNTYVDAKGVFKPGKWTSALENATRQFKSSQVNTLPKAKSETRSKQNKDMHKCSSVYSERGVPLPILTSGGE